MFKRLQRDGSATGTLTVDGKPCTARASDTVAAALLASGLDHCRTTAVSGTPRAPYCMMGVCFECLVEVDGCGSVQGCLTPVRDGMRIVRQQGRRSLSA